MVHQVYQDRDGYIWIPTFYFFITLLIQAEYVDSWLKLDNPADIQNLFQMTPYYYKTGREEHARLEQLESLSTQISFEILQYRAVAETGEK